MPPIPTVRANAHAIRAFCDKDDLSIDGLAKRAGVAGSAVHYYVHGKKRPTLRTLYKLAQALGVPVQAICMDDLSMDQRESA
jgi:transcriptional regulator with XRE-family HTH domain